MGRYTVDLYDVDNDHYTTILETDNELEARYKCEIVGKLMNNKDVIIRRNDCNFGIAHDEPFDYVLVYDHEKQSRMCYYDL